MCNKQWLLIQCVLIYYFCNMLLVVKGEVLLLNLTSAYLNYIVDKYIAYYLQWLQMYTRASQCVKKKINMRCDRA